MYSVVNLNTLFFLLNIYIIHVCIWAICSALKDKYELALKGYKFYEKWLFWGGLMRLIFELYLKMALSLFISIPVMDWWGPMYTASVLYSNLFSVILTLILFALPIFIMSFYSWQAAELDDKLFLARYGNIIEGLWLSKDIKKRKAVLLYPFWFCVRRILFVIICCIKAEEDTLLQVVVALILAMVTISYLVVFKPFLHPRINALEIMNEATNFILLYHVILFSGFIPEAEDRYIMGWSFIAFTVANLVVHLGFMIDEIYRNLRKWRIRTAISKIKPSPVLSVIVEESFESNFSEKPNRVMLKGNQSDWNTVKMGGSVKGFDLGKITWNDLGNKFMLGRGAKKSNWPNFDPLSGGSVVSHRSYTLDERYENYNFANDLPVLSNDGADGNRQSRQLVA